MPAGPARDGRARAVAFDLFHTLVDPEEFRPPEFHRASAVAARLGLPEAEFTAAWNAGAAERQVSLTPTVVERVRSICRSFGVTPAPAAWAEVDDLLGRYTDLALLRPRATVVSALRRLRESGWTLGLLSNCDERERRGWSRSELARWFDAVVFSCEVGAAKPSTAAFRALVPRWGGIPLEESVFVGDGANDELVGARRAGFARVVFQAGFVSVNGLRSAEANERVRAEADAVVRDVSEVPGLLGKPARRP